MKLIIKEQGDSSVGIPSCYYQVECPFDRDLVSDADLRWFADTVRDAYGQFAEGRLDSFYDDEVTDTDIP